MEWILISWRLGGKTEKENEEKKYRWCPFEYEYLPDFCYVCGVIGHVERECSIKIKPGVDKEYGSKLCFIPPKSREWDRRNNGSWKSGSLGARGSAKSGSESLTWKKQTRERGEDGDDKEIDSPIKKHDLAREKGGSGKGNTYVPPNRRLQLFVKENSVQEGGKNMEVDKENEGKEGAHRQKDGTKLGPNSDGTQKVDKQGMTGKETKMMVQGGRGNSSEIVQEDRNTVLDDKTENQKYKKGGKFVRRERTIQGSNEAIGVHAGEKRDGADLMEVEEGTEGKKSRRVAEEGSNKRSLAGLSEQPCVSQ